MVCMQNDPPPPQGRRMLGAQGLGVCRLCCSLSCNESQLAAVPGAAAPGAASSNGAER